MITFAEPSDKEQVYQIWKTVFANDDGGYTDYYFRALYDRAITYVIKEAGVVKAVLQRQRHELCFHGHVVSTSMILGVATLPQYRRLGLMHKLMEHALADALTQETVTMIQAYHPELYLPFGFQVYYHRRTIPFQAGNQTVSGYLDDPDCAVCLILYQQAMIAYEGTIVRSKQSFVEMQEELQAQGGRLLGYYEHHEMKAYAAMEFTQSALITECFGEFAACMNLLTLAERKYGRLKLQISDVEGDPYTMLAFHDWADFCRLTDIEAPTADAYFQKKQGLLFMHENA